jgi:uncharacterized protein with HEPN domain
MSKRIVSPCLSDIIEAIKRIRHVLDGISLEAFEADWKSSGD